MLKQPKVILSGILVFSLTAGYSIGQVVLTHDFISSSIVTLETEIGSPTDFVAFEPSEAGSQTSERLQLNFSNDFQFEENSVTHGWASVDILDQNNTTTRTYYYSGLDEEISNEFHNFDSPFTLNYSMITNDPGRIGNPTTITYNYTARAVPGLFVQNEFGSFSTQLIGDPSIVPEPRTYALMMGLLSLLPIIWLNRFKYRLDACWKRLPQAPNQETIR